MCNNNTSQDVNQISYYVNLALSFMPILKKKKYLRTFHTWLNKFEYVAEMIKVPDNKIIEFFENMVQENIHKRIMKRISDTNSSELSYEKIINHYVRYYCATTEIIFYRRRFKDRSQYEQETIEKYSINLEKLHDKCGFKKDKETRLCKQFLIGIRREDLRTHLTISLDKSFDETVRKAIKFERTKEILPYMDQALSMINTYNLATAGEFHVWLNKFEYTADMIEVPDQLMLEFFEQMIDNDVHRDFRENNPTLSLTELTYEDKILKYHHYFSPSDVDLHVKRLKCRNQYENEKIDKYAKNLLKLFNKSSSASNKNELLCEQFFNGISDDNIRNYLKQFSGLSFEELVEKAIKFWKDEEITFYVNQALTMIDIFEYSSLDSANDFCLWFNRFEHVVNKIEIPSDKIGELFFKMVHDNVHMLIKNQYLNINVFELSYYEKRRYYINYFFNDNEKKFQRNRFKSRLQYDDESLNDYIINLQKIYISCLYEYSNDKILCEQFLYGIRNDKLKEYLTENICTTFNEMMAKAIEFERTKGIHSYVDQALSMINIYNQECEGEFDIWLNKFEYVADMIEVPDVEMVEFFNRMVDQNVHTSVKKKFGIIHFPECSYEIIVIHYLRYFLPDEVDLYIKRFKCRNQYEKETIAKYYDNLKKIYDKCDYLSRQRENFCERFINGIINDDIRSHLNNISGLPFNYILSIAINMEEKNFHLQVK